MRLWRTRFTEAGPSGLAEDAPHGPSAHRLSPRKVRGIVEATLHTTPPDAIHWSTRTLAHAQGVSHARVVRIWDAHGLPPHRIETFKLSKDTRFVEKLTDVVGVYLNPPDKAVVLCVDKKSQAQALDRTQLGLPMKKGRCGTITHDYKRHGTTWPVRGAQCARRHRDRHRCAPRSRPHQLRKTNGRIFTENNAAVIETPH